MEACEHEFHAELLLGLSAGEAVLAGCSLATALLGAIACAVVAVVVGTAAMVAARERGLACRLRAPDNCPW